MTRLVPSHKCDDEACANLKRSSNEQLLPYLDDLLEWLQDMNWPVAAPVAERLSLLGEELVAPITKVLNGDDDAWKYWLVCHLLHKVKPEVYRQLLFKLHSIKNNPTAAEVEEEVYAEVCVLLNIRQKQ